METWVTAWWQWGWVVVPTEVTVAKKPAGQRARHTKKGTLGGRKRRLGRPGFEKAPHFSGHTAVGSRWSPQDDGRLQEIWESQGKSCGFGAGRVRGPPRDGRWVTLRGPLGLGSPCAHLSLSAGNSNTRKGRKGRKGRGPECCPPLLTQSPGGGMQRGGECCVKPPRMVTKPCGCQPAARGSPAAVPNCARCGKGTGEKPRTPRVAPAVQGGTPSSSEPSSLPSPSEPRSPTCISTAPTSRLLAI